MSGFRWRLDPVLRLRSFECERARVAHERAAADAAAAKAAAEASAARLAATDGTLRERLRAGVPAWELNATRARVADLRAASERDERLARAAEERCETARGVLLAAHGRRRALERLREKVEAARRHELALREQAALDERAQRLHAGAR